MGVGMTTQFQAHSVDKTEGEVEELGNGNGQMTRKRNDFFEAVETRDEKMVQHVAKLGVKV